MDQIIHLFVDYLVQQYLEILEIVEKKTVRPPDKPRPPGPAGLMKTDPEMSRMDI
jgi:hypothetical protein